VTDGRRSLGAEYRGVLGRNAITVAGHTSHWRNGGCGYGESHLLQALCRADKHFVAHVIPSVLVFKAGSLIFDFVVVVRCNGQSRAVCLISIAVYFAFLGLREMAHSRRFVVGDSFILWTRDHSTRTWEASARSSSGIRFHEHTDILLASAAAAPALLRQPPATGLNRRSR